MTVFYDLWLPNSWNLVAREHQTRNPVRCIIQKLSEESEIPDYCWVKQFSKTIIMPFYSTRGHALMNLFFCGNRHHASTIHDIFGSCVINGMFTSISKIVTPHFLNKIIYFNWDFWHDKFFHAFQKKSLINLYPWHLLIYFSWLFQI